MSLASNNLLKTINSGQSQNDKEVRLATVIELSSGNLKVQFYGEEEASSKVYKRLNNSTARVGSTVMMQKVNGTYVMIGVIP